MPLDDSRNEIEKSQADCEVQLLDEELHSQSDGDGVQCLLADDAPTSQSVGAECLEANGTQTSQLDACQEFTQTSEMGCAEISPEPSNYCLNS